MYFLVAFNISSSNATLPVTMVCVTNKLKVKEKICNFYCLWQLR
jgi:Na+/H+-dicarboxylate symporter